MEPSISFSPSFFAPLVHWLFSLLTANPSGCQSVNLNGKQHPSSSFLPFLFFLTFFLLWDVEGMYVRTYLAPSPWYARISGVTPHLKSQILYTTSTFFLVGLSSTGLSPLMLDWWGPQSTSSPFICYVHSSSASPRLSGSLSRSVCSSLLSILVCSLR